MKQNDYPALRMVREFGKSCPNIYTEYDQALQDINQDYLYDTAVGIANKYFQTFRDRRECAARLLLMGNWRKNKQVYRFPREFYGLMQETESFNVSPESFATLPYRTFYLEFLNDLDMHGTFVHFIKDDVNMAMLFCCCMNDGSHIMCQCNFKDGDDFETSVDKLALELDSSFPIQIFLLFAFQACMYLCARNCDIKENAVQKSIYRCNPNIKDKYREIQSWDVAFRLTEAFKKSTIFLPSISNSKRNRPRTHWRRAHWHTYWTGKGRTHRELKFVLPTLVNEHGEDLPVVTAKF